MIDLKNLSPEQRAELKAQIEAEDKAEKARVQNEREAYKSLVDQTVENAVKKLTKLSCEMEHVKQEIFAEFSTLIKTKNELFKTKINRQSDTFTTTDGRMSITLGNRVNEGWDDTVEAGIEKVKEYLQTLAKDDNSAELVQVVMGLLSKDRKGALKANKVLELEKLAATSQDEKFIDGINIIKAAYRPVPTCQFIQVDLKDEEGKTRKLPLSLSAM
ncbi:DUF3164 family protein [uncultured Bacteroides sp.]|jgi:DUF438 domain-containing protein|uniref:DUF3164 family protein n=1 Tax=uncultured Bacteroides sp. TaxID=162156 RepID=UPI00205B1E4D|nr:DUF3164 family protein [uncultured Bacteroides sp.]DAI68425.1 MAG TPA: Protein of unknown function (DUF3164) [Caudoviricetes sp.]